MNRNSKIEKENKMEIFNKIKDALVSIYTSTDSQLLLGLYVILAVTVLVTTFLPLLGNLILIAISGYLIYDNLNKNTD